MSTSFFKKELKPWTLKWIYQRVIVVLFIERRLPQFPIFQKNKNKQLELETKIDKITNQHFMDFKKEFLPEFKADIRNILHESLEENLNSNRGGLNKKNNSSTIKIEPIDTKPIDVWNSEIPKS